MKVFFIGFGQAGGKIVDRFIEFDNRTNGSSFRAIAVNTARTDLMGLQHLNFEDRVLIGQTSVKGHGVGTDNDTGAQITFDEIDIIMNAIDRKGIGDTEAFIIVSGLGGGTGSGGSPVLARHLKKIYKEPVYVLGILPAPEEGRLYSYNAARSLATLVKEADNVILFDNSAWKNEGESIKGAFDRLNDEIVRRFGLLFRAGEIGQLGIGEMVVDSSEIINTLRGGGISSVGYAISEVINSAPVEKDRSFFDRIIGRKQIEERRPEDKLLGEDKTSRILSLVRRAMLGRLTLPCEYTTTSRALVLVAGPPDDLDRKGIEKAKSWVEENIAGVEVRGGDYPAQSRYVAAVVLLASIADAPRVTNLLEIAKETKATSERIDEENVLKLDESIEPLFE
ncbi:Tubulin/FtsZ, GTPase [Methanospirillum hungatei JF-1]|jgi:cell division GTPase FtsZ|uniref:Tubulin-like protein CetZ n=1 Tax=Methanospirillum hungatei JF-1 (strain ATCC 27890 / DSM 864 / NBRC 100397 / JF-1) TaxID=323259 RepID=Q2FQX7_METHJ|nr:tubulin/FtsZ family protein [Methanospirillum hungatei]MBP9007864.1 cell division protein [Methanospirillum sp.]OQA57002.1 MAG: cell division protein FtsZ [Euryarchaeota archaeon ADurb.Bin294]ABD41327.1 Tubulin/FtsZ, GTPase [Methanospirillum hungatei JF-1]MCA1915406.1 tubulin/FtsZ family protein [Methanospirillum hungatei]HOW06023.1 tubulin/FtsZ family protein [Methanospirillum hungatei]